MGQWIDQLTELRSKCIGKAPWAQRALRAIIVPLLAVAAVCVWWVIDSRQPDFEALGGFSGDNPAAAVEQLGKSGIAARLSGQQVEVAADQHFQAIAILQQEQLLSNDLSTAFDRMIADQSLWTGERQKQREFLIAKQKVLGRIIGQMGDVQSAVVMLDLPQRRSFGASRVRPSASVSVTMKTGAKVDAALVQSIAGLVSGAVTQMSPDDVTVIDTRAGRRLSAAAVNDPARQNAWLAASQLEDYYRQKISQALAYIPGAIVTVSVDPAPASRDDSRKQLLVTRPAKVDPITPQSDRPLAARGGLAATSTSASSSSTTDPGQSPDPVETKTAPSVNVTINVPRSYIVNLHRRANPIQSGQPKTAAVDITARRQLQQIESQVQPLVGSRNGSDSQVQAYMFDDAAGASDATAGRQNDHQSIAAVSTIMAMGRTALRSPWAQPIALAAVLVMTLGLFMRRRQAQPAQFDDGNELSDADCEVIGRQWPMDNPMRPGSGIGGQPAGSPMPPPDHPGVSRHRPFSLLRGLDAGQIRICLEDQPATDIATVLSFLPYRLTAEVLEGYAESKQHKIVRLIATMPTLDRDKTKQLEQQLADQLAATQTGQ